MNINAQQKLRRSASKSAACKPLTLRIAEWHEGQDPQLWRKAAGGNNENAMSSASAVALKMNSSTRNARPQGNHAGSHPIPLYPCPNGHGTPPYSQCSRTQPRTPYPRNQAQRNCGEPSSDRALGRSRRHHDPANLKTCPFTEGKHQMMELYPQNLQQRYDDSSFGLSHSSPRGGSLLTLFLQSSRFVLCFCLFFWLSLPELLSTFQVRCSTKCALLRRSGAASHQRRGV